jgi:NitT/TauT family transport system substrate-binding protein
MNRSRVLMALSTVLLMLGASPASAVEQFGELRFATPGPFLTTLPMEVVRTKGFDKEEGFSSVITRSSGPIAIKAMIAGDFDFSLSGGAALTAAVSGLPVKVVYVHVDKSLYFLFAQEGITKLKDLEGKRVGIDAVGGTTDIIVRRAMRDSGANPSKTVFVAVGSQNVPTTLAAGAVEAGVITPPREFQLKNSKIKFVELAFLGDYAPGLNGGVATTDKAIKERPQMVRAVIRAHAKAHRFILENREETVAIMSRFANLSPEDAARSYDTTVRPHYNKTGAVDADIQKTFVEEQMEALKLTKAPALSGIFDFSFIPK